MDKRVSSRAIIFEEEKVMLMFRVKGARMYHVFPGGKREEGESLEQCVIREVLEEFGINVEVVKKVYECETPTAYQHYYLCKWVDGIFGTGQGEEFSVDKQAKGYYEPRLISIEKMETINVVPKVISSQVLNDLKQFGKTLCPKVIKLNSKE